ncbi:MAG: CPBP family intramembrane metalloprotease [Clostridia bacterium]|nr:CPBP family intramembrane metalloprotease [Clostridia bacterium]
MNYYSPYNNNQNNTQPRSPQGEASAEAVFAQKYRARRAGNAIGGGLIIFSLLPWLLSFALDFMPLLMGFDAKSFYTFFATAPGIWIYQAVVSFFIFTLPFVLASVFYGQRPLSALRMGAPKKGMALPLILAGLGASGVANMAAGMFESVVNYTDNTVEEMIGALPTGFWGVVLTVVAVCVVPALAEEFAFRGIVLGLLRNVSEPFAVVVSALLFGLMHGNLSQIPSSFLLGLILGYAVVATNSIWPACAIHFLSNGISVVVTYLSKYLTNEALMALNIMMYAIMLGLGIIGFILFVKKNRDAFRLSHEQGLSGKGKAAAFFLSPCIIIFLIITIIETVLTEFTI